MIKIRILIYVIESFGFCVAMGEDIIIYTILLLIVFLLLEVIEINDKIK